MKKIKSDWRQEQILHRALEIATQTPVTTYPDPTEGCDVDEYKKSIKHLVAKDWIKAKAVAEHIENEYKKELTD